MNPILGWALAALFALASWQAYGWGGLGFAVSAIVFWLLLQFNRSVRVMREAAESPVGRVPSAVMLQAKLGAGMTMLQIVRITKSLGRHVGDAPETWAWGDDSGAEVRVVFDAKSRCTGWALSRPPAA